MDDHRARRAGGHLALALRILGSTTFVVLSVALLAMSERSRIWCDVFTGRSPRALTLCVVSMQKQLHIMCRYNRSPHRKKHTSYFVPDASINNGVFLTTNGEVFRAAPGWPLIVVPHWLAALFVATLAIVPWIGFTPRFSLRLFILVATFVAILLGWLAASVQRSSF